MCHNGSFFFLKTVIDGAKFYISCIHYIYFIVLFKFTLFKELYIKSFYNFIAILIIQLILWHVANRLIKHLYLY